MVSCEVEWHPRRGRRFRHSLPAVHWRPEHRSADLRFARRAHPIGPGRGIVPGQPRFLKAFGRSVTHPTRPGSRGLRTVVQASGRAAPGTDAMTTVLVDPVRPGILKITLNRPERLNAMNAALVGDLH